jgi:hypothetical protein
MSEDKKIQYKVCPGRGKCFDLWIGPDADLKEEVEKALKARNKPVEPVAPPQSVAARGLKPKKVERKNESERTDRI